MVVVVVMVDETVETVETVEIEVNALVILDVLPNGDRALFSSLLSHVD